MTKPTPVFIDANTGNWGTERDFRFLDTEVIDVNAYQSKSDDDRVTFLKTHGDQYFIENSIYINVTTDQHGLEENLVFTRVSEDEKQFLHTSSSDERRLFATRLRQRDHRLVNRHK